MSGNSSSGSATSARLFGAFLGGLGVGVGACLAFFGNEWETIPEEAVPYLDVFFSMVPRTCLDSGLASKDPS